MQGSPTCTVREPPGKRGHVPRRDSTWHSRNTLLLAVGPAAFLVLSALVVFLTGLLVDGLILRPGAVPMMDWKRRVGTEWALQAKKVSWCLPQVALNMALRLPGGHNCDPSQLALIEVASERVLQSYLWGLSPEHWEGGTLPFPRKESPGKSRIGSWDTRGNPFRLSSFHF